MQHVHCGACQSVSQSVGVVAGDGCQLTWAIGACQPLELLETEGWEVQHVASKY